MIRIAEMNSLVTVVIPAYNASRFLERTLRSVQAQTYSKLEILLVDDGSGDDTAAIAHQHAETDPRIRVISTRNQGVAAARNLGIELARGKYLAFADADDLWHPTKIEKQMAAMARHANDPSWAGVYALCRIIDEEDRVVRDGPARPLGGFILCQHLVMKLIGNGSSLLVRRDAALAVGGFDTGFVAKGIGGCEDLDFELRLATHYRIDVAAEMLVGYRSYEGNMSSNTRRMVASITAATEICIAANPQLSKAVRRFARAQVCRFTAEKLSRSRSLRQRLRSMLAFLSIPLHDPALFGFLLSRQAAVSFKRFFGTVSYTAPTAPEVPFGAMDPAFDVRQTAKVGFWERRLSALAAADALLERVRFDSVPSRPILAARPLFHAGE